jgi:kynureninase
MLTLRVPSAPALVKKLRARGAMADARPPDILRVAAPPLYTRFEDVHRLASLVLEELG